MVLASCYSHLCYSFDAAKFKVRCVHIPCSWCCVPCFLNSYLYGLTNLSKFLRKSNQLTLVSVGTNVGPFAKTNFCEGIRPLVEKLIAFYPGDFSLIFLILFLKLDLFLFFFFTFFLFKIISEKTSIFPLILSRHYNINIVKLEFPFMSVFYRCFHSLQFMVNGWYVTISSLRSIPT